MNLCKDCKYFTKPIGLLEYCSHPSLEKDVNLVNGDYKLHYCFDERANWGSCKPEGINWEKRVSWWKKLWN